MTVSVKQHLSGPNIFPAMLISRSTGPEDARTHKCKVSRARPIPLQARGRVW